MDSTFPDRSFLAQLNDHLRKKIAPYQTPTDELIMLAGAALNWLGDDFSNPNMQWTMETLSVDSLWLTGTGPAWNAIIIDRCERSPEKLRQLLFSDPVVAAMFGMVTFDDQPILVRHEDGKFKMLDGMHRAIAAIRDGHRTIHAWVGRPTGQLRPSCEPHVVYDFLRAYQRKLNTNRAALITALRFLRKAYTNVDPLLRERFGKEWLPDDDMQRIIAEVLADETYET